MRFKLVPVEHADEMREIHELAFSGDFWPGDDHTFWVAYRGKDVAGFCSAIHRPLKNYVFLSRAAVAKFAQGYGLQRRMIRHRIEWAAECGVKEIVTYTSPKNYPSMMNLLRCGFQFYTPDELYAGPTFHYLRMVL